MYKVMIVEDDEAIAQVLARVLEKYGYQPVRTVDFAHVDAEFAAAGPHLVLLDIGLPLYDGYHWCRAIRAASKVPILFLSSAADNMNQVLALSLGADDFLAKPFDLSVAMAKVEALLRRAYAFSADTAVLACGGAVLNLQNATVSAGGQVQELTKNEFRILQLLFSRRGRIVPRADIMQALWDSEAFVDDNTLTVNIARLRKKLDALGLPELIRTQKGVGYLVEDTV